MVNLKKESKKELPVARSNLKNLIAQRERDENRSIPHGEIAQSTGLDEHTIGRWMRPTPFSRIEVASAAALCQYLKCTWNDLLVIEYPQSRN
jgi:DNA-binding Xre family transcriptional regulator